MQYAHTYSYTPLSYRNHCINGVLITVYCPNNLSYTTWYGTTYSALTKPYFIQGNTPRWIQHWATVWKSASPSSLRVADVHVLCICTFCIQKENIFAPNWPKQLYDNKQQQRRNKCCWTCMINKSQVYYKWTAPKAMLLIHRIDLISSWGVMHMRSV